MTLQSKLVFNMSHLNLSSFFFFYKAFFLAVFTDCRYEFWSQSKVENYPWKWYIYPGKWYILSFHSKATTSASVLVKSNSISPLCLQCITKKAYSWEFCFFVVGKSPEKVLNFGHKNLCERCSLQPKFKMFNC